MDENNLPVEIEEKVQVDIEKFARSLSFEERQQLIEIDPGLFSKIWQAAGISAIEMFQIKLEEAEGE